MISIQQYFRQTGDSIIVMAFNMIDVTKRDIKALDELKGQVVLNSCDNTFSSYYQGIANINLSDYFEVTHLPHIKLLMQLRLSTVNIIKASL